MLKFSIQLFAGVFIAGPLYLRIDNQDTIIINGDFLDSKLDSWSALIADSQNLTISDGALYLDTQLLPIDITNTTPRDYCFCIRNGQYCQPTEGTLIIIEPVNIQTTATIRTIKMPNNDIYYLNAVYADDADTLDGQHASEFVLKNSTNIIHDIFGASTLAGSATSGEYLSVKWYTVGVDGITEPFDGMKIMVKIPMVGVGTAGVVLSLNGNYNDSYHPCAYNVSTVLTTHFPLNSYKIFTYNASATMACYLTSNTKTTVTGVWIAEADYDSNTNTIGYQLRTNSAIYANKTGYSMNRYTLLFEVNGGLSGAATSIGTGTSKTTVAFKYIPGGVIKYYTTSGAIANDSNFGASGLWDQYTLDLRYTFNIGSSVLSAGKPVYMRCTINSDGTLSPNYSGSPSHPIVVALPTAEDNKVYVYLGRAYSTTNIELDVEHPCYEFKGSSIRLWNNSTIGTVTSVNMSVPTGLSVTGNPITSSGTLAISYASGYSIPTTTKQDEWDSKTKVTFVDWS